MSKINKKNKAKKDKTKNPPLSHDLKLFFRGMKIAYSLDKRFFWMQIFNAVGDSFRPYINSFMAALIIDGIAEGKPTKTLIVYALIVVGVNLVINFITQYTAARRYIRKSMWNRYLIRFFNGYSEKMDYWRFEDSETKEKWERIKNQIDEWKGIGSCHFTLHGLAHSIFGTAMSVGILVTMILSKPSTPQTGIMSFINSPWMIFVFAAMLIIVGVLSSRISLMWRKINDKWNAYWGKDKKRFWKMAEFVEDNKRAMDLRIYNFKDIILKENNYAFEKHLQTTKETRWQQFRAQFGYNLLNIALSALSYVLVGLKALSGAFGLGSVVLYVSTLVSFNSEASYIGWTLGQIRASRYAFEDQFSYIDMPRQMYKGTLKVDDRIGKDYNVEFRNVSFKYPGCEEYALKNVYIKFNIGRKLAVVGMNGSGKTTFIKLLCRLYDPTEGEILLNGIDIKEYDYDEYMSIFSVVFQDFKLFAFSLAENVATSKQYDAGRVERCLENAGFGERLTTLPKGIETSLYKNFDKDGIEISGGEAQRIALARALYKDAPFIILDEPTAALDPLAEAEVYSNFNKIVGDKTAVYISHRLSSCKFCDEIVVFDDGSIVQRGTHDELVDVDGKYNELWYAQAQYYAEDNTAKA